MFIYIVVFVNRNIVRYNKYLVVVTVVVVLSVIYGRPMESGDHIYFHAVVCSFFLFLLFFPRLISAAADWMSAILPHMVWP